MNSSIRVFKTKNLSDEIFGKICVLKNTYWNYGISSQIDFFDKNIKKQDLHVCLFNHSNLIGYVSLKERKYKLKRKKKYYKFYLFDSLIVKKKLQNKKLSTLLIKKCHEIIEEKKFLSVLVCHKRLEKYYINCKWNTINNNQYTFKDYYLRKNNIAMLFGKKLEKNEKLILLIK